jgi:hypothetical protein
MRCQVLTLRQRTYWWRGVSCCSSLSGTNGRRAAGGREQTSHVVNDFTRYVVFVLRKVHHSTHRHIDYMLALLLSFHLILTSSFIMIRASCCRWSSAKLFSTTLAFHPSRWNFLLDALGSMRVL